MASDSSVSDGAPQFRFGPDGQTLSCWSARQSDCPSRRHCRIQRRPRSTCPAEWIQFRSAPSVFLSGIPQPSSGAGMEAEAERVCRSGRCKRIQCDSLAFSRLHAHSWQKDGYQTGSGQAGADSSESADDRYVFLSVFSAQGSIPSSI